MFKPETLSVDELLTRWPEATKSLIYDLISSGDLEAVVRLDGIRLWAMKIDSLMSKSNGVNFSNVERLQAECSVSGYGVLSPGSSGALLDREPDNNVWPIIVSTLGTIQLKQWIEPHIQGRLLDYLVMFKTILFDYKSEPPVPFDGYVFRPTFKIGDSNNICTNSRTAFTLDKILISVRSVEFLEDKNSRSAKPLASNEKSTGMQLPELNLPPGPDLWAECIRDTVKLMYSEYGRRPAPGELWSRLRDSPAGGYITEPKQKELEEVLLISGAKKRRELTLSGLKRRLKRYYM